ncbi:hypothetical protein EDC96DRAFT_281277 [Choanephora cucurbitarum]|nr:hypothetical protein EDC96DRAFT_281277 [Choanephora cucurbitarum]
MKHLYPTPPGAIPNIKRALNLQTDEEAYDLQNIRKYYDLSIINLPAPEVNKQDKEITSNGYTVKISILRPVDSEDTVLPVILYLHVRVFMDLYYNTLLSSLLTFFFDVGRRLYIW